MAEIEHDTIEIRPDTDVYATYRRLSYTPWYAIAEFVDNSTQSFFDHEAALAPAGAQASLEVRIWHDANAKTLTVYDNAFGMERAEMERAVRLNKPPANTTGRSEYGMGLKTAACWMGDRWTVTSKQLGSDCEYAVSVDVQELATTKPESIDITSRHGLPLDQHYTKIEIADLHRVFRGRTIGKIKDHLASMYRRDLESGRIAISYGDDDLQWDVDPVFTEMLPSGEPLEWKRELEFSAEGLDVSGFVALRMPGKAMRAGFTLFRRGRVVLGGPGEGWKPYEIFGAPNSFSSQRVFGELNLDQWPVTQAKDGFDWDGGHEAALIDKLRAEISVYTDKAEQLRRAPTWSGASAATAALVADGLQAGVGTSEVEDVIALIEEEPAPDARTEDEEEQLVEIAIKVGPEPTMVQMGANGRPTVKWWLSDSAHELEPFLDIAMPQSDVIHLFVNLKHPFVRDHVGDDPRKLNVYLPLLLADAMVERAARRRPEPIQPHALRKFKDSFLRAIRRVDGDDLPWPEPDQETAEATGEGDESGEA